MIGITEPLREVFCQRCSRMVPSYLCKNINANGSQVVYEVCIETGKPHRVTRDGRNISHAFVERLGIRVGDILPLSNSARIECEVRGCAELGVEIHHWAPQSIFEDSEDWPFSPLCLKHHRKWHDNTGVAVGRPILARGTP